MSRILCVDTDDTTVTGLRQQGYAVETGELGYQTGLRRLTHPPHEFDLVVCDLRNPVCFDSRKWGPGGHNDNTKYTRVSTLNEGYYRMYDKYHPIHQVIKGSHIRGGGPGQFGPDDIRLGVEKAGVTCLLILNRSLARHVDAVTPNFFGVCWRIQHRTANVVSISDKYPTLKVALSEKIKLPIEFEIVAPVAAAGLVGVPGREVELRFDPLVFNAVGQTFGQVVPGGRGKFIVVPELLDSIDFIKKLLSPGALLQEGQAPAVALEAHAEVPLTERIQRQQVEIKDIFISHASEDKADVVLPLAEKLMEKGVTLWLDKYELKLGDSLRQKIEDGLRISKHGLVLLSKSFFAKRWPQMELDALFALERDGKRILPVWHGIDEPYLRDKSPILAGRLGIATSEGLDRVVAEILRAIR